MDDTRDVLEVPHKTNWSLLPPNEAGPLNSVSWTGMKVWRRSRTTGFLPLSPETCTFHSCGGAYDRPRLKEERIVNKAATDLIIPYEDCDWAFVLLIVF